MISDDKKEEVRETADLVEVIGDYVRLKRSGSGYLGLCPFHDEKTPSFHVTPRMGIYKCFGCDASGDIFSFIMEMEGVGFQEALRSLAERYGIHLPESDSPESSQMQKEKEGVYHALRFAGLYYFRMLKEADEADKARRYLKERGYSESIVKKFGLGYAPGGGDQLFKAAVKEGIDEEYLLKADLIKPSKRNDGFYDTFRDRLIFPIFNPSGKVIAFAGRVLDASKTAKYINSSQTLVYNKSEVVYGVNFAKREIRKEEEVILVEGYTDVITLVQNSVGNVVSSSGTSLTPAQIRLLKRYADRIVMIYDSDSAGQAAMLRGVDIALSEGMDVDLLELPEDEDPDSYVKKNGGESFRELKRRNATDFVSFTIEKTENEGGMEKPSDRSKVISRILESIAEIPDSLSRQVYVQHLHQKTQKYRNSSDRELFEELSRLLREKEKRSSYKRRAASTPPESVPHPGGEAGERPEVMRPAKHADRKKKRPLYEMELIRLMLEYGSDMIRFIGGFCNESLFEDDQLRTFYQDIIERHQAGEEVSVEHYSHREEPYPRLVGDVVLERYTASDRHYEKTGTRFKRDREPFKTAKSSLKPLRLYYLKRHLAELAEQTKQAGEEEKRELVKKQKRTQGEISRMERSSADDLFPDPDWITGDGKTSKNKVFDYKMKEDGK